MSDYLTIALLNSAVSDKQQILMLKERIAIMEHQYLKLQRECVFSDITARNRIQDLESQVARLEQAAKLAQNRDGGNGMNEQDNQRLKARMESFLVKQGTAPPNPSGNQVHNLSFVINAPNRSIYRARHEIAVFPVPIVFVAPAVAPIIKQTDGNSVCNAE